MTETRVIIDNDREATPDQMVTMQDGIEASIDHIVGDTLVPTRGYAGMLVSYQGTVVTVGAGRLYNTSKVYAFDTASTFDMVNHLPLATKRTVLITAYGSEVDTDVAQVNFLIEAESTPTAPVYKPSGVATTHKRLAIVGAAYGDEAANPVDPDVGLSVPVARITLTPAGIASCVNLDANGVPNLSDHEDRIEDIEAFDAKIGPQVSSLATDLANLAKQITSPADNQQLQRIELRLADLDAAVGIPSTAADSSADTLFNSTNTDIANVLSHVTVDEGWRFPDAAANDTVPSLFNPFDTAGSVKGGLLIPTYTRYPRRNTGAPTGSVLANSYTYNPVAYTEKTITSSVTNYGKSYTVSQGGFGAFSYNGLNAAGSTYDPITGIYTLKNGETFKAQYLGATSLFDVLFDVKQYRLTEFWTTTVTSDPYWDAVVQAPVSISGYHVAMSELIGQDQWIDAVGFTLKALDAQGDVTVIVCEATSTAAPDPTKVLSKVTIPYASLLTGTETVAPLPSPVLLSAGKRIAYILVTTGAHTVATTDSSNYPGGTFFALAPSGYAAADLTKNLCLTIYGCKFAASVASLQLQNLQLAGGIENISIQAQSIAPASTSVIYEMQLAGVWTALSSDNIGLLNAGGALPPNVPFRVTFSGTPDMMPALNLAGTTIHTSRPDTTMTAVWPATPRTPPVSTQHITVIEQMDSFDSGYHTAAVKLLTGAGYTTQTSPSTVSDDTTSVPGSVIRTSTFNLGAAVASYKVMTSATTSTSLKVFSVSNIKDYVL